VVEELEGEVVGDEVLCRKPVVIGVPVTELLSHLDEFLTPGMTGAFLPEEEVVKDLGRQFFRREFLQMMGDRVIRHVDGGIAQWFDEPVRIPGEARPEAHPARACPILQPIDRPLEFGPHFRGDDRHLLEKPAHRGFPFGVAVHEEPLVMQDLDEDLTTATADNRPDIEFVHVMGGIFFDEERTHALACLTYRLPSQFRQEAS